MFQVMLQWLEFGFNLDLYQRHEVALLYLYEIVNSVPFTSHFFTSLFF